MEHLFCVGVCGISFLIHLQHAKEHNGKNSFTTYKINDGIGIAIKRLSVQKSGSSTVQFQRSILSAEHSFEHKISI
jgi:hypothetical protein